MFKQLISDTVFPPVNYIGNKTKLSSWIVESMPLDSGIAVDLFAGGSSVSYELKKKGFQVYSNDVLYSSYVVNKALIENNFETLDSNIFLELSNFSLNNNIIRDKYSWIENKLYYEDEVNELATLIEFGNNIKSYQKYIFLSLIRRSMIRKLPYSRMNIDWENIMKLRDEEYSYKKYGRKRAYHNMPFIHHIKKEFELYNDAIFDNDKKNKVTQLDAVEAIKLHEAYDIIYLDPPYPGTMNNYEGFYGSFDDIFNKKIKYSDWTNEKSFMKQLNNVLKFSSKKARYLMLSINSSTKPSPNYILDLLKQYGEVIIREKKHNYQVSGKNKKNKNIEFLFILKFYSVEQLSFNDLLY